MLIEEFIIYIGKVRRYANRTIEIYRESLTWYAGFIHPDNCKEIMSEDLSVEHIRNYEIYLMEEKKLAPSTIHLYLSSLSSMCKYMIRQGLLKNNPVSEIRKPVMDKKLPYFYHKQALEEYFRSNHYYASEESLYKSESPKENRFLYNKRIEHLVISILYSTGIRRGELIGLKVSDVDMQRQVIRILGKGNKMREIPVISSLCKEISLYLQAVKLMVGVEQDAQSPLLVTFNGEKAYPVFVDRLIKQGLANEENITGQKSPHILRHTIATELLNDGTDLYSIKEFLGHSSLAATQVYTHNSISKLKKVYETAHPRANKNGGKNGD